ncbi:hypothetical protein H6P81_002504 [Aristolochia fimbriata]|uniref:Uncharacterized protein n=1 Tax=Aristolochia fimbriata TaxID=158543 RepID=A0AAV7FDS7_ARIFI|nr:hypothetical protein H6P81_002504 [Aristolochia fimbriata]
MVKEFHHKRVTVRKKGRVRGRGQTIIKKGGNLITEETLSRKKKTESGSIQRMKITGMKIFNSVCLCLCNGCPAQARAVTRPGTRIWNLTERPIELQIRVGSILKKGHTLKPGRSKRLRCKAIYKAYMPSSGTGGLYYDEMCQPYVWIHDTVGELGRSRVVKQQYLSLEDLRDFSEIRVVRDHHRGCILEETALPDKMDPESCTSSTINGFVLSSRISPGHLFMEEIVADISNFHGSALHWPSHRTHPSVPLLVLSPTISFLPFKVSIDPHHQRYKSKSFQHSTLPSTKTLPRGG